MRHCWAIFLVGCLITMNTGSVLADSAADFYLDSKFWKDIDWKHPETTSLYQLNGWEPANGDNWGNNVTEIRRRNFSLQGYDFEAHWLTSKISSQQNWFTVFSDQVSYGACLKLADVLRSKFGVPIYNDGTMNFSFSENSPLYMANVDYQWDLKNTRISASCFGTTTTRDANAEKGHVMWSVKYSTIDFTPKLIPKFALQCSQKVSVAGIEARDIGDFPFWVDISNRRITNVNNVVLSDPDSFRADEGTIEFSITSKDTLWHYTLGRVTGSLEATIKKDGLPYAGVSGNCEKTESLQKKF